MKMPTVFLSHGSPMMVIEKDSVCRDFFTKLADQLPRPKSILIISAHWQTQIPTVTTANQLETIYDFRGFPDELYQLDYTVSGATELSHQVRDICDAEMDNIRGLDHGAWAPLSLIYPKADIPVTQLSLPLDATPQSLYEMGQALSPLRDQGVLIIASGSVTHGLRKPRWQRGTIDPRAQDFENWFIDTIKNNDHNELLNAATTAPDFTYAHPTNEHWIPLYVALGAAQEKATLLHRGIEHEILSMAAARFD